MKRLRESGLIGRLFLTYLAIGVAALVLLEVSFLYLINTGRASARYRDVEFLARLAKEAKALPQTGDPPRQAHLIRTEVGRALLMPPAVLKAFRTGETPPTILVIGEAFRRSVMGPPAFAPREPETVPAVVTKEVTTALRAVSEEGLDRAITFAQWVTVCPPQNRGTGVHCAIIVPLEPRAPVHHFMVALLPPGPLDQLYEATLRWLWPLGGLLLLLAAVVAWQTAMLITNPLRNVRLVAERVASGDLSTRVGGAPPGEMGRVVTVFNEALDQLAAAKSAQEETDRKRRELVASVSHEFRAPLASLRGYLELLQDGVIPQQDQAKYVAVMLADTFRLNRLMDDLLEWARIQAQRVTLRPMPTDGPDACHRVAEQLLWQAGTNGVELVLDLPPAAPLVMADPDRLDQVLVNLLENALRYAGRGGWVRVTAALTEDGQALCFAVIDSGPGIPPAEQAHVWERFYKVDKARTPGEAGSGLGLAIVKQLVEAMGGQVGLKSQVGQGSTFWFTLPLVEPHGVRA